MVVRYDFLDLHQHGSSGQDRNGGVRETKCMGRRIGCRRVKLPCAASKARMKP
jgi:hypothetical protein